MGHARLLIILLVAATVLVDLVALWPFAVLDIPPEWPHQAVVFVYSLLMGQVSLAAIWAGFGGKLLPWRMLGLVLLITIFSRVVTWVSVPSAPKELYTVWTTLLLMQATGILAPLTIARINGVKLIHTIIAASTLNTSGRRPPLQFSLGYLLSWITVLAVVLGILQYTADFRVLPRFGGFWQEIVTLSLTNAVLALVALWLAFGTRWLALRVLAVALTVAIALPANSTFARIREHGPYAAICMLQVLSVAASLSVFRVAGYRIARRARAGRDEPANSLDAG